ncbi:MAG: prepilin-type N-terminal cleavage/methylation domain-containing protein [Pseudomonadota bacterium]
MRTRILSAGKISARPNNRGFTLLELIIVLILIGILTAMVAPRLGVFRPGLELKTSSGKVAAIFRYAGDKAVSENRNICVAVDIDTGRVVMVDADLLADTGTEELGAAIQAIRDKDPSATDEYQLPEGIAVDAVATPGVDSESRDSGWAGFYFYTNGSSTGGTISLMNARKILSVISIAFITGTVRIES